MPKTRIYIIAVVLAGMGYIFFSEQPNEPNRLMAQEALPPIVHQVPGILWDYTGRKGSAPFQIKTTPGADYYIKLVDYNSGADRMGIFVKGGQTLEVNVPPGSYKIRYAFGEVWRGLSARFGPGHHTNYQQSNTRFDFSPNSGYSVELIRQPDGNMRTHSIDASQF